MTGSRVAGLIEARDEWPLVAVSISHALMHHADSVWVVAHSCTDGTSAGLALLQDTWGDRLHVFHLDDERFWQEATTSVLLRLSQAAQPDWIYVFDADEFLLTRDDAPLGDILGSVGPDCSVVRYQVQNWVSSGDFDDADPTQYVRLRHRSQPNLFAPVAWETMADEIWTGNLNFFDLPFGSKIILRNDPSVWIAAGAHDVRYPGNVVAVDIPPESLRVAHLPFLSRSRLQLKVRHGQQLISDRFPPSHGWQDQLLWRFDHEGLLDEFWQAHSLNFRGPEPARTGPS